MTTLLLDENLPERIVSILNGHGLIAIHVRDEGFGATSDRSIWDFAIESGLVVFTKDADYLDLAALSETGRVILLATGNMKLRELCHFVDIRGQAIKNFVESGERVLILKD